MSAVILQAYSHSCIMKLKVIISLCCLTSAMSIKFPGDVDETPMDILCDCIEESHDTNPNVNSQTQPMDDGFGHNVYQDVQRKIEMIEDDYETEKNNNNEVIQQKREKFRRRRRSTVDINEISYNSMRSLCNQFYKINPRRKK